MKSRHACVFLVPVLAGMVAVRTGGGKGQDEVVSGTMVVSAPFDPGEQGADAAAAFTLSLELVIPDPGGSKSKELRCNLLKDEAAVLSARGDALQWTGQVAKGKTFYEKELAPRLKALRGPAGDIRMNFGFGTTRSGRSEYQGLSLKIKAVDAQNFMDAWYRGGVVLLVNPDKHGALGLQWIDASHLIWNGAKEEKGS